MPGSCRHPHQIVLENSAP